MSAGPNPDDMVVLFLRGLALAVVGGMRSLPLAAAAALICVLVGLAGGVLLCAGVVAAFAAATGGFGAAVAEPGKFTRTVLTPRAIVTRNVTRAAGRGLGRTARGDRSTGRAGSEIGISRV